MATASSNFGSVLVPSSNFIGPGIWTGSCGNGIFQFSVCGKQLQYCRKRKTPITTTAPVLQRERESKKTAIITTAAVLQREREREIAITTTAPVLQIGRTAITTTAPILQREKLQLLRPLKYCRQRETAITTTAPVLQREKLQLLRPLPVLQKKRTCKYYDRSSIAEREIALTTTAPVLQKEGNYNCCDPSSMANREKLQVLRPPQCCRDREAATITTAADCLRSLGASGSWTGTHMPSTTT